MRRLSVAGDLKARPTLCTRMHGLQEKLDTSLGGKTDTCTVFQGAKRQPVSQESPALPTVRWLLGHLHLYQ